MLKKFVSSIRKKMQYNKFVVAVYNFFAVEILFRINGVKRKMKKQDCVFSDETLKSKFYLPYYKTDLIQRSILTNRNYFEYDLLWNLAFNWNEGILAKKIKDKAMLDIGANIGNHTLFFMNECGASGCLTFGDVSGMGDITLPGDNPNNGYDGVRGSGDLPMPSAGVYTQVAPLTLIKKKKYKNKKKKKPHHTPNPSMYDYVDDYLDYVDRTYKTIDKLKK